MMNSHPNAVPGRCQSAAFAFLMFSFLVMAALPSVVLAMRAFWIMAYALAAMSDRFTSVGRSAAAGCASGNTAST